MNWYLQVFKRTLDFNGRSRRRELWMFVLFNTIVAVILAVVDSLTGSGGATTVGGMTYYQAGLLGTIYSLVTLIPGIAVSIRRLHDIDRSGWWLLIALVPIIGAIVLIVFWAKEGTRGSNRFGVDPKVEQLNPV